MSKYHPVRIAMKAAARVGCDPLNSHTMMTAQFNKLMRDRVRRVSEAQANRLLARQAE